jgi:hypothetical protein
VIGDGGMNRGDAAAPHLPKDRLEPVAVLQTVDDDIGLFRHGDPLPLAPAPVSGRAPMISKPSRSFNRQMTTPRLALTNADHYVGGICVIARKHRQM